MLTAADFRPHQVKIVQAILSAPKCYLIADMGSGKTGSAIFALTALKLLGEFERTLIIAPMNVAKFTWPEEFEVWDFGAEFKVLNIAGKTKKTRENWVENKEHDILVINREQIRWLCQYYDFKLPYGILIYDEISRLKAGKVFSARKVGKDGKMKKRTLSEFGHLRKVAHRFKRVIGLTGTPTQEGVIDLWGQFRILDGGKRLGTAQNGFLMRWFHKSSWEFKWTPRPNAENDISDRIKDIAFYIDTHSNLKDPIIDDRVIELSKEEYDVYKEMQTEFVFEDEETGEDIEAVHSGALTQKLLQLANGGIYRTDKTTVQFHDHKLDELQKIIDGTDDNVLVFYSFQFDRDKLAARFPQIKFFDSFVNPVKAWNSGNVPLLAAHPASASHGLNLQYGGHTTVWYGLTWSLELYQQANKRLQRPGQTEQVIIHRIMAKGTVDEEVAPRLVEKAERQEKIMEGLKR